MKLKVLMTAVAAFGAANLAIAADYEAPRTEWGQPDLQGVWNFASNIPMTRPAMFGDNEYMTQEQADMLASFVEKQYEALNNDGVGGYNTFWVEQAGRGDNLRTSLITYPTNGQVPERVEGTVVQIGGLGPDIEGDRPVRLVVGGIGKDSYEDRGISERCIVGFNSGPPFTPSMYNNNIQIVQSRDTVVVMTEMIARECQAIHTLCIVGHLRRVAPTPLRVNFVDIFKLPVLQGATWRLSIKPSFL